LRDTVADNVHDSWAAFITRYGLEIRTDLGVARAYTTAHRMTADGASLVDLNHLTTLRLAGPDARAFLQGYLTCDLEQLDETHAVCGAYCNIKGRVVADALTVLWEGQPTLLLHASLREAVATSLAKYLAFSRSRFDPPDRAPILLGLIRPQRPLGASPLDVTAYRGGRAIAVAGTVSRALLLLSETDARSVWQEFATCGAIGDATAWDEIDVHSGIAHVHAATSEHFLPQMLDYDAQGCVSFTKGCYLGQEIVARTQHLGRPKRGLHRLSWHGELPQIGSELRGPGRTGTLVGVIATQAHDGEALAVLNDGSGDELSAAATTFRVVARAR
jgi:tRNA-modifying protein YgfZ